MPRYNSKNNIKNIEKMLCPLCGQMGCMNKDSINCDYHEFNCNMFSKKFAVGSTIFNCSDERKKRRCMNLVFEHIIGQSKYLKYFYDENYTLSDREDDYVNVADIQYPYSFSNKVDRVLLNLYKAFPNYADKFNPDSKFARAFFSETADDDEAVPFINLLVELGYVRKLELGYYSISAEGWKRIDSYTFSNQNSLQGFIAMEFSDNTSEIGDAFSEAIKKAGYSPMIIRDKEHNNQIVPEILSEIDKSRFLVMDATYPNFGAYYEAGYALGRGKQVIVCCESRIIDGSDKKKKPHFDIAQKSMVIWNNKDELIERLKRRIEATVK